jgi:uncharacterized membrane protein
MEQPGNQRRYRIIIGLQILRFVVAAVMLGLAFYYRDVLLAALAVAFVALGTFTTWKRLQMERDND